jgi:hypothetical protein
MATALSLRAEAHAPALRSRTPEPVLIDSGKLH